MSGEDKSFEHNPEKESSEQAIEKLNILERIKVEQGEARKGVFPKFSLNLPNTIGIKPELWDRPRSSLLVRGMSYYASIVSIITFAALLFFMPFSISWALSGVVAAMVTFVIAFALQDHLIQRERKQRAAYREEQAPKLVKLFKDHNYDVPSESSDRLPLSLATSLTILDNNENKYHTWDLEIHEDSIQATMIQINQSSPVEPQKSKSEVKVQQILDEYVKSHGEFNSPEMQDVFLEGVHETFKRLRPPSKP